ncbi:MAG: DUF4097 family beta strand repeat-containing protein [Sarcina sp.]
MKKTSRIIIWILVVIIFLILILGIMIWYIVNRTDYVFNGNLKTKDISYEVKEIGFLEVVTDNLEIYVRESGNKMINLSLRTHNPNDFNIKKINNELSVVGNNKTLDSNFIKWLNNNLKYMRKGKKFTVINPKLIIEIPANSKGVNIDFKVNTGNIMISNIVVKQVTGNLGSGNLNLNNIITQSLNISDMQGDIICDELYSKSIILNLGEGNLNAKEVYSKNITMNVNKGDLSFINKNKKYDIPILKINVEAGNKEIELGKNSRILK